MVAPTARRERAAAHAQRLEAYWSASIDDGGETTALTMLEAFETEREAKRWSIGAARELLTRAIQDLEAI